METYVCEECNGTGTRERVWDSAPLVCIFCDGFGQCVVDANTGDDLSYYLGPDAKSATAEQCVELALNFDAARATIVEIEATAEYEPIVVTRIIDARPTAEVNAAWAKFRERVAAMGVGVPEVEK